MARYELKRKVKRRLCSLRKCMLVVWDRILACSFGRPVYLALQNRTAGDMISQAAESNGESIIESRRIPSCNNDSDLVLLKISLLGDCQIGKTRFMEKYVGNKKEEHGMMQGNGLNLMGKTLKLKGARISYNIWEVENKQRVSLACGDAVAILIMFDLTSRVTLNSVINWYEEARKWNQTGIAILVGTKFDEFIQLPIDVQWAIASQARAYAKALNSPLFFSSAAYNINVNKVFKFVTAKLFDLPWPLERNLTIGEPIIDF